MREPKSELKEYNLWWGGGRGEKRKTQWEGKAVSVRQRESLETGEAKNGGRRVPV